MRIADPYRWLEDQKAPATRAWLADHAAAAVHNLSGSVTGVLGDPAAVGSSLTFGSGYTNAGTHTGSWTFTGGTNAAIGIQSTTLATAAPTSFGLASVIAQVPCCVSTSGAISAVSAHAGA